MRRGRWLRTRQLLELERMLTVVTASLWCIVQTLTCSGHSSSHSKSNHKLTALRAAAACAGAARTSAARFRPIQNVEANVTGLVSQPDLAHNVPLGLRYHRFAIVASVYAPLGRIEGCSDVLGQVSRPLLVHSNPFAATTHLLIPALRTRLPSCSSGTRYGREDGTANRRCGLDDVGESAR